ncbi:hypothetical protein DET49_10540 [Salegentibacter sp. 24]|uniref:hypothetical protein n=1 Tax=Salegentibacter sp. 24 TaxID=2183986 RepID=UPI00105CEED4|nr:hypothetical protein [Salegentibacter sp. 24]TDN90382.1 hypothetical protein DET49_10540 [Salegentibacter sp. 24]
MKPILIVIISLMWFLGQVNDQFSKREGGGICRLSAEDQQEMMTNKLDIKSLRPGPSADPNDPNAANSDETKVSEYTLPGLLLLKEGSKVNSIPEWEICLSNAPSRSYFGAKLASFY